MGQIILASDSDYVLSNGFKEMPKPISDMSIAHVFAAEQGSSSIESIQRRQNFMKEKGFDFTPINLEEKNSDDLGILLADKELIFVDMGNTFYLLKAIKESGFDEVVKQRLAEGATYLGASAGSYVACPTIEMATWKHPDVERHGLTDLTAMGLVDFLVTVHYVPENDELLRKKISECQYPVKILSDQQGLLINDGEVRLIGEGEEVDLSREDAKTEPFNPETRLK